MKSSTTNTEKGVEFELYIQSLYEGLGWITERNVKIGGQQVDIVIRKAVPGVGLIKYLVECKYLSSGTVSNQEVHNFSSYVMAVKDEGGIIGGLLVTNRDFTADAKVAADNRHYIELRRQIDLEKDLFDVSDILRLFVRTFEADETFSHYVNLSGVISVGGKDRKRLTDVLGYLETWSARADGGFITVLGDFGSGKTTLLQRLHYRAALAALTAQFSARTPIFFMLRDRQRYRSLEAFIETSIQTQFETKIPLKLFWQQLKAGRFIIILDGFDEVSTQVTAQRRAQLFYDLCPLLTTRSPALMSCRPSYFVSRSEFAQLMHHLESNSQKLLGAERRAVEISDKMMRKYTEKPEYLELTGVPTKNIDLDPLDNNKIDTFLRNRETEFNTPWPEVKRFLLSIYDLKDLMSRPILLSMITDTVIEGKIDVRNASSIVGPSGLYETYTDLQFGRDTFKGEPRRFLTPDQRRYFSQATAIAMLEDGALSVSYGRILDLIDAGIRDVRSTALPRDANKEEIATDVSVCAFLIRTSDDRFRFAHKSFMEFFVAQFLKKGIDQSFDGTGGQNPSAATRLLNRSLPAEVLMFLSMYSFLNKDIIDKMEKTLNFILAGDSNEITALKNINQILINVAGSWSGIAHRKGLFRELRFIKGSWKGHTFNNCEFSHCSFTNMKMRGLKLQQCVVEASDFMHSEWHSCQFEATARVTRFETTEWTDSSIRISSVSTDIAQSKFNNSSLMMRGRIGMRHCDISGGNIIASGEELCLTMDHMNFLRCSIMSQDNSDGKTLKDNILWMILSQSTLDDCFLFDIWINDEASLNVVRENLKNGLMGLVNVKLNTYERLRRSTPDSGRIEMLAPGFFLAIHGQRRLPSTEIADFINNSTNPTPGLAIEPSAVQASVAWKKYVPWLRKRGSRLLDLPNLTSS